MHGDSAGRRRRDEDEAVLTTGSRWSALEAKRRQPESGVSELIWSDHVIWHRSGRVGFGSDLLTLDDPNGKGDAGCAISIRRFTRNWHDWT